MEEKIDSIDRNLRDDDLCARGFDSDPFSVGFFINLNELYGEAVFFDKGSHNTG